MGVLEIIGWACIAIYTIWIVYLVMQWTTARASVAAEETHIDIAVIIPFRNESENLNELLTILTKELHHVPHVKIILVDDQSDDNSLEVAKQFSSTSTLVLSNQVQPGKKGALHTGILHANVEWIITLDADTAPQREWLVQVARHIETHQAAHLLIFPVWMEDEKQLFTRLQALEWMSVIGVTGGMAMGGHPILCNGANLAFRKDMYSAFHAERKDWNLASGDDFFLLEYAREVIWIHDRLAAVSILGEPTLSSFIQQRMRWAGKTKHTQKNATTFFGSLVFLTNFLLILSIVLTTHWWMMWCVKALVDLVLLYAVSRWLCKTSWLPLYPLLALIYPCYAVCIPLLSLRESTTWKGREIRISN